MDIDKQIGFSLWCDFIERDFLQTKFQNLIRDNSIQGATSNPSIFSNSILTSPAYRSQIASLKGQKAKDIYENLAIYDIKKAANLLRPLWENNKDNGYISIEIDPLLGEDAPKSIDEGRRLFATINEPNVMIKVPATQAGYEVMETLFKNNIPINATLVFSPQQAKNCSAIFKNAKKSTDLNQNRAVISIFVSRFDRATEGILKQKAPHLLAKLGILNAMECYKIIEENQDSMTRTLFASTGVKGDDLPKSYYIEELLLPHSVNTAPLDTINAYLQKNNHTPKKPFEAQYIAQQIQNIQNTGIDLNSLYQSLMQDGLKAFIKSFEDLLSSISQ